ncbi:hypothetical protein evm_000458 [Chilo suppressalis]|nr:hypothetical protein evm_000405 [Chilo suppressalis]RVE55091.1 hypothetical protein evm_000458 [Chilo suppressalis]
MLRKSIRVTQQPVTLMAWDRNKCVMLTSFIIVQCVLVYIGSATILNCVWSPDWSNLDYDKLARIMYLYDYEACGHKLRTLRAFANIRLSNETYGLDVKPITWKQAVVAVSTRLSSKTRKYIELSLVIHVVWMTAAITLHIVIRKSENLRVLKAVLMTFLYISICVIMFDISMAIVYIAHIQQSLTKSMILRYSGWSVELKLRSYDDFAGWLPMAASVLWMRGIVILIWNIYCCKFINRLVKKIKKKEVTTRLMGEGYLPVPEPRTRRDDDSAVLYYRTGENKPYVKDDGFMAKIFYGL